MSYKLSYKTFGKRLFDIFISVICLLTIVPLLYIILGILIKIETPGPILFRQKRIGYGGKIFTIFKFRTYTHESVNHLTRFGQVIDKLRLNEFPNFWNVLIGDMSIVGPRPLPIYFYEDSNLCDFVSSPSRTAMLPGITGPGQVSNLRGLSYSHVQTREALSKLEQEYGQKISFKEDLKIISKTLLIFL